MANRPPIADITGPVSAIVMQPITVDGSSSQDPDGLIRSWEYDFLDGNKIIGTGQPGPVTLQDGYQDEGDHTIVLTVWDGAGQTGAKDTAQWIINIKAAIPDIPPEELIVSVPSGIIVESDTGERVVTFVVTVHGGQAPIELIVTPPSGSVFPLGKTIVTVTAFSTDGQEDSAAFVVEVIDISIPTVPLELILPANIITESLDGQPVAVTYEATTNGGIAPVTITIDPPSGSLFHIGTRGVQVLAISSDGQRQSGTFTVKVISAVPVLVLHVPSNQTLISTDGESVTSTYQATTTGGASPVTITYDPPSGSKFSVGTSTVTVIARSADGQQQTGSFKIIVNVSIPGSLVLTIPSMIEALAPDSTGVSVNIPATVTGGLEPTSLTAIAPVTLYLSGIRPIFSGTFPVGTTSVTIKVTDANGVVVQQSCDVIVTQAIVLPASSQAHLDFDERAARSSCIAAYSLRDPVQLSKITGGDKKHTVYDPIAGAVRIGLPNKLIRDGVHTGIVASIPNQIWIPLYREEMGQLIIIADWKPGPLWNLEVGRLGGHKHFNLRTKSDKIWFEPNTQMVANAPTRLSRTRYYFSAGPPTQTIPGPFTVTTPSGTSEKYDTDSIGPVQNNVYVSGEKWVRTMIICDQRTDGWCELSLWVWIQGEDKPWCILDKVLQSLSTASRPHHFDYEMNTSTQRGRNWSTENLASIPYIWAYGRDVTIHRGEPIPLILLKEPID